MKRNLPPLAERIARQIRMAGPIRLDEYMYLCLAHPDQGYYATGTPIGADGDFITAPEVSQIFGELIGIWCLAAWKALGEPSRIALVEIGPGRGTLMADLLRAAALLPDFLDQAEIFLVETSPRLRQIQKRTLAGGGRLPIWVETLEETGDCPIILVANEFLDALPVHQYVKHGKLWLERRIGIDKEGNLTWCTGPGFAAQRDLPPTAHDAPEGAVFEHGPARTAWVARLALELERRGGVALLVDYGYESLPLGDTFQAVRDHSTVDPLAAPGQADLTAHVDFTAIRAAARACGAIVSQLMTQRAFLVSMGIRDRLARLTAGMEEPAGNSLADGVRRLVDPDQMGELFKVLALAGPAHPAIFQQLPPFETE